MDDVDIRPATVIYKFPLAHGKAKNVPQMTQRGDEGYPLDRKVSWVRGFGMYDMGTFFANVIHSDLTLRPKFRNEGNSKPLWC